MPLLTLLWSSVRLVSAPIARVSIASFLFACVLILPPAVRPAVAQEFVDLVREGRWVEMGEPGAFQIRDGVIALEEPRNYPNWLRSEREYENFVLELEYETPGWAEGGIYLNAPLHGDPVRSGIKIHLRHDRADDGARSTGAIFDVRPPIVLANETGEWNHLRVEMNWPRLRVWLNGALIQDVDTAHDDRLRYRLRRGYLGIEDCGTRFRFRNVRIRELPPLEPPWTHLFNGRDLSGWGSTGSASWTVRDGVLEGRDGDGVLRTDSSFSAYEFRTYFRTTPHANGGIFYRMAERPGAPNHYEAQIYDVPTATYPTGSIYGIVPATDVVCRSGEWCLMQVISDGPYSRVLVNGRTVARSETLALPDSGRIGIQHHSLGAIEYKDLRVKPLRE